MFDFFLTQPEKKFIHSQLECDSLEIRYQELVVKHHIQSDAGQIKILGHLQQLMNNISAQFELESEPQSIFSRLIPGSPKTSKSLYIFGDVGRGKSMLMDVFFDACPIESKRRVHFHAFMQEAHEFMYQWRKKSEGDSLLALAEKIRSESLLLCFDEFHITDIADAMLLARLFTRLFGMGLVFVATSNQHPDDLYKNGLQRELFLPFIDLLKQSTDILELVAKEDYRLSHLKAMKTTFYSEAKGGDEFLHQSFNELTNGGSTEIRVLKVKGREISFAGVHGDILLTTFNEMCGQTLGSADYLVIADEFSTILISGIPDLSVEIRDQVRRFVTLIDALYEHNVKLICTATLPAEQLTFKDKNFDFKRTRSRLCEMQTKQYFQRKHLD